MRLPCNIWYVLHWNCGQIFRPALKQARHAELKKCGIVFLYIFQYKIQLFHHSSVLFDGPVWWQKISSGGWVWCGVEERNWNQPYNSSVNSIGSLSFPLWNSCRWMFKLTSKIIDILIYLVFSGLLKVILKVPVKDHEEMTGLCGSPLAYTVYLCVKQLNKNITMFFNVNISPLAPQYRKLLLQISTISVRNIDKHVLKGRKKPARHVTTSDGSGTTFTSHGAWNIGRMVDCW